MEINNRHKLKDNWLMYTSPYREKDLVFGSPVVDASTYDTIKYMFDGIAIKMLDGTVYAIRRNLFEVNKKKFGDKYYVDTKYWTIKKGK